MRFSIIISSLIGLLLLNNVFAKAQPLDRIVAYVNDEIITYSELQEHQRLYVQTLKEAGQAVPAEKKLQQELLDKLIEEHLVLQTAKSMKVNVDNKMLDEAINNIAKQNNLSLQEMKKAIQEQGITYQQYRNNVRKQMISSQVYQSRVASEVSISKAEVDNYLRKENARRQITLYHLKNLHIPIPVNADEQAWQQAKQSADKLFQALQQGKTFSQLLMQENHDSEAALNVGDLGKRSIQDLPEVFAKPAKQLRQGQYSQPVRASNGYHILHLVSTEQQQTGDAISKEIAERMVYQQKFEEAAKKWLADVRENAYVKVLL
jgi:peptidyl-prolyl cis-trans isomerase SurA